MFEITFGGFDEIRDQVIATLELDINLRKRVFESVAQSDQSIVNPHDPKGHQDDKDQQYAENGKQTCHDDFRNEGQNSFLDRRLNQGEGTDNYKAALIL